MEPLKKLLSSLSLKQKIYILVAAVSVGAGLTLFTRWRHEADFRPLYTAMAPEDAAGVVQKLRETGVEYRLSDNGSAVMVSPAKLAESRLALAAVGLPKTGRIGFELFDKSNFGATEFVEHINYKRALEGELERSVMSLAEVEQARVHVTLPKESVFIDQQQPAKASVMVKLRPGASMSVQNVSAVTHMVAGAVEGLQPEAVTLVDVDGNLLSRPKRASADGAEFTSEAMEAQQHLEHNLIVKITDTLDPLLGAGSYRAGASVDFDLTSGDQQEETLDPTQSVMVSSQKTEDSTDRAVLAGVPGTQTNLPSPAPTSKIAGGQSRRSENITYQTSRVIKHTKIPQGVLRRMSLAVLVGQGVAWEGEGANRKRTLVPPAEQTLKTIKDLVAGVTGFDAERGDQLVVETLPFDSTLKSEPPKIERPVRPAKPVVNNTPVWLQMVMKYQSLWVAAVLAMSVIIVLFRIFRRSSKQIVARKAAAAAAAELSSASETQALASVKATAETGLVPTHPGIAIEAADDNNEMAERVRQLARREPAAAINVLRMWIHEGTEVTTASQ